MNEVKLKPGDDTTDFVLKFNEANFDIMCALDRDEKSDMFGFVFFRRTQLKKYNWIQKLARKIFRI